LSPLTSAECLAIAERKIVEAMSSRRHGKELKLTAQAWMVLAEKVRQGGALKKQAEALEVAKVAPDRSDSRQVPRLKANCRRHPEFPAGGAGSAAKVAAHGIGPIFPPPCLSCVCVAPASGPVIKPG